MAVIKVQTTITGFLFSAQVWLEGREISLSYDGNKTWTSTDMVDVSDGILNMIFHGQGLAGTDWTLNIDRIEPDKNLFKNAGSITATGHSLVADAVKIS